MNQHRHRLLISIRIFIDLILYGLAFGWGFLNPMMAHDWAMSDVLWIGLIGAFISLMVRATQRLYSAAVYIKIYDEYAKMSFSGVVSFVAVYLMMSMSYPSITLMGPTLIALMANLGLDAIFLTLNRTLIRSKLISKILRQEVILVGINELSDEYYQTVKLNTRFGHDVRFVLGDANPSYPSLVSAGPISDLAAVLQANPGISTAVIALRSDEYDRLPDLLESCSRAGIQASIIPDYQRYLPKRPHFDTIGNVLFLSADEMPLDFMVNQFIKRIFDIVFSLTVLIVLSPVYLLLALLVKLSSPGPVFYRQQRIGLNNRPFTILKFRSMRMASAEEQWSPKAENRTTTIGKILRKVSLDELPQFYNVLIGDMSVVGPRPERGKYVDAFSAEIPKYRLKHRVKPGITGLAQVNGFRGDTDLAQRIHFDLYYIENWTFFMDLFVILRTVLFGFVSRSES